MQEVRARFGPGKANFRLNFFITRFRRFVFRFRYPKTPAGTVAGTELTAATCFFF
ncbi:MAG: hypothetical protein BJ554DRAFT_649, partial [Olpidium bornovanus]